MRNARGDDERKRLPSGRLKPPKIGDEDLEIVYGAIAAGATLDVAAQILKRQPRWLDYQVESYPSVRRYLEQARRVADGIVQNALFNNAVKRMNVHAQKFWLINRAGWVDRKTQVAGAVEHRHTVLPKMVERSFDAEVEAKAAAELKRRPPIVALTAGVTVDVELPEKAVSK